MASEWRCPVCAARCRVPQWQGWPRSAGSVGQYPAHVVRTVAPARARARPPPARHLRVLPYPVEGLAAGGGGGLAAQYRGMTPACPHRAALPSHSGRSWPHSDGSRRAEPHAVSATRRGAAIHLLTLASLAVCEADMRSTVARGEASSEVEMRSRGPGPSSEAEIRSRGSGPSSEAEMWRVNGCPRRRGSSNSWALAGRNLHVFAFGPRRFASD